MQLSTMIKPDAVKVVSSVTSKKRLFQALGETAQAVYGLSPKASLEALQDRESLGPTGFGNGIALPHARLESLDRVVGVFMRLERPLDFDAVDRQPVDLIFALFAPLNSGVSHLKALASVSRIMRDADVCSKLRANNAPATLYTILTEVQQSRAA